MVAGGFLVKNLATSEEVKEVFPDDFGSPPPEGTAKNIFIFHDESTFNANDDESLQWGRPESQVIRTKSRGSSIMVSDFITENDGYLCLTPSEYDAMKQSDPSVCMGSRTLLEYGENRDGYWTSNKFMKQMRIAVKKQRRNIRKKRAIDCSGSSTRVVVIWPMQMTLLMFTICMPRKGLSTMVSIFQ